MGTKSVVIVTGASQGLGAAISSCLATRGAAVCLVARTQTSLKVVQSDILDSEGEAMTVCADVADPHDCRRVVESTLDRYGRLDALVNNAGVLGPLAYTEKTDGKAWLHTLEVNVMGPYYLAKKAMPFLRDSGGRIVNVSSGASTTPLATAGAYCVSKAALNHFTCILAAEETQVTSVAVRPGVVDTPMQATLRGPAQAVMPKVLADYYKKLKTDGSLEPPEVPARSIAWLALNARPDWSGRFLNYDDPEIAGPAADW